MVNSKKILAGTSPFSNRKLQPDHSIRRAPHIYMVLPNPVPHGVNIIKVKGAFLDGQIRAYFKCGEQMRQSETVVSVDSQEISVTLPSLSPGKWSLQLEHDGGKSPFYPIEIQSAPVSTIPVQASPESNPAGELKEDIQSGPETDRQVPTPLQVRRKRSAKTQQKENQIPEGKNLSITQEIWEKISYDALDKNMKKGQLVTMILLDYFKKPSRLNFPEAVKQGDSIMGRRKSLYQSAGAAGSVRLDMILWRRISVQSIKTRMKKKDIVCAILDAHYRKEANPSMQPASGEALTPQEEKAPVKDETNEAPKA